MRPKQTKHHIASHIVSQRAQLAYHHSPLTKSARPKHQQMPKKDNTKTTPCEIPKRKKQMNEEL